MKTPDELAELRHLATCDFPREMLVRRKTIIALLDDLDALNMYEDWDQNYIKCEGCQRHTMPRDMVDGTDCCLWCMKIDAQARVIAAAVVMRAWYPGFLLHQGGSARKTAEAFDAALKEVKSESKTSLKGESNAEKTTD